MVKEQLGYKHHWAVADYLQRAARHIASQTDVDQAFALGEAAVELAVDGANAVMPTIERLSSQPYRWRIGTAPLHRVANREKKMPRRFITKDGFGITAAGKAYFEPLIAGEAYPDYQKGMPRYTRLRKVLLPKRCDPWPE
jgi:6-phosphofructokinase 1